MAYLVLLVLAALDAAGYSVIAPVAPAIAEATGAGPSVTGALVGSFAAGMTAGFVAAGAFVGRRGASAVIAVSLGLVSLGCLGFVLGEGLWAWFPARAVMGIGSGGLWIGIVFGTIERFPAAAYPRLAGVLAAYSVGGVAGPALGGLGGIRTPFAAYLALVLLGALALGLAGPPRDRAVFTFHRAALREPGFALAAAGVLVVAVGIGLLDGTLPLHFASRLTQAEIALLYVCASLVLGAAAVAAGRWTPGRALAAGTALVLGGLVLAGAAVAVPAWIAGVGVAAVGFGLGEAGALGVLLAAVRVDRIVVALVAWSQVWAVGYLAGPILGGVVAEAFGFPAVGAVPAAAALLLAVVFSASRRASRARPAARPAP